MTEIMMPALSSTMTEGKISQAPPPVLIEPRGRRGSLLRERAGPLIAAPTRGGAPCGSG